MALISMELFSKSLNQMTGVEVILPMPRDVTVPVSDVPVLYLLHGMGDDRSMWLRKTRIEQYAIKTGIAVVMPDGGMSCYENMRHGAKYRDYILEELPENMEKTFPVSKKREKRFIAGCSMGGCGAFKLAFAKPERYSVCGSFSAGYLEYRPDNPINTAMLARAFGDEIELVDEQIERDLNVLSQKGPKLKICHYWGDRDKLKEQALETKERIEGLRSEYIEYRSAELDGAHDWDLWEKCIERFMNELAAEKTRYRLF